MKNTPITGGILYNVDNVWTKPSDTADAWTAACFLAKNVMKFPKGLLWLVFEKSKLSLERIFLMTDSLFLVKLLMAA